MTLDTLQARFLAEFPREGKRKYAMRLKGFSVEPIVAALRKGKLGTPVADPICKVGITEQIYKRWKKQNQ